VVADLVNDKISLSSPGDETPEFCNGSAGSPFHILTDGTWEGKTRVWVKFDGIGTWQKQPDWNNKNIDVRLSYPQNTKLKVVAEELTEGMIEVTIGH
jgi:hypothetical protein